MIRTHLRAIREKAANINWPGVVFFTALVAIAVAVIVGSVCALFFGMLVLLNHTAGCLSIEARKAIALATPDALVLIALIVDGVAHLRRRLKARAS